MAIWGFESVPNTYYNILYHQILSWDENNIAELTSDQKKYFKAYILAKLVIRT